MSPATSPQTPVQPDADARERAPTARSDALCLVVIALLSSAPYVARLGFYSDDWPVLAQFHSDVAHGQFGLNSVLSMFGARPVMGIYAAGLFVLFGLHPLAYHLVNSAVIAAAIAAFYLLLLRMKVERSSAIAAAIVFLLLPQLSTIRVWYSTFQVGLSLLMTLLSLHWQLSFARSGKVGWALAAAAAALLAIGAYEIFAPFLAAFPIALLALSRSRHEHHSRWRMIALGGLFCLVGLCVLGKYALSSRAQAPQLAKYIKGLIQLVRPDYDWRTNNSLNLLAAAEVHLWWPLVGWARGATAMLRGELPWIDTAVALVIAAATFCLLSSARRPQTVSWTPKTLLLLGLAVFVLGHAAFLLVPEIIFSPTGIGNRALVAAALGVAIIAVAAVDYAVNLLPKRRRAPAFATLIGLAALFGTLRTLQIAEYWAQAPALENAVFARARTDLRTVPANSTVILDNVCPYHGPAVLFETYWDVGGAFTLLLGRPVSGDTVSPRMFLRRNGLATSIYGEPSFYRFGSGLYVYDPWRRSVVQLSDFAAALRYFRGPKHHGAACPRGYPAHGVLI